MLWLALSLYFIDSSIRMPQQMDTEFLYTLHSIPFDEHYRPADATRLTTNFANLARGENRQENLKNTLKMIDNHFNSLAHWDNPRADRYSVRLEIISVEMSLSDDKNRGGFQLMEVLRPNIIDKKTGERTAGIPGNNFSSYVRDYDFSVALREHNKDKPVFEIPDGFGQLHGKLFQHFVGSDTYSKHFHKPPVICISVSSNKTYYRTENQHPILGVEYRQSESSLTDYYFEKMGMRVRYFMPPNSVAPYAFYFVGDLLNDYSNLELIGTISTMDTFQKIYRPEIYNANSAAGSVYKPSLENQDCSLTKIVYDREERNHLATKQGKYAEVEFIKPYGNFLKNWVADYAF